LEVYIAIEFVQVSGRKDGETCTTYVSGVLSSRHFELSKVSGCGSGPGKGIKQKKIEENICGSLRGYGK
jgi:hypothetical protein